MMIFKHFGVRVVSALSLFLASNAAAQTQEEATQRAQNLALQACQFQEENLGECLKNFQAKYALDADGFVSALQNGCVREDGRACYYAGHAQAEFAPELAGSENDPALADFLISCKSGYQLGCTSVYLKYTELADSKLQIQGQMKLKETCYKGEHRACEALGNGLSDQRWEKIYNLRSMSAAFNEDCRGGNVWACAILGHQYNNNFSKEDNLRFQKDYLNKGCGAGIVQDCIALGLKNLDTNMGPADPAAAQNAFERGCDMDSRLAPLSCSYLGHYFEDHDTSDGHETRAMQVWSRSCREGYSADCADLVAALSTALNENEGAAEIAQGFTKSCDSDNGYGCYLKGEWELLTRNTGGADRAEVSFEESCGLDNPLGCRGFGLSIALDNPSTEDTKKASDAAKKACDLGDAVSCQALPKAEVFAVSAN